MNHPNEKVRNNWPLELVTLHMGSLGLVTAGSRAPAPTEATRERRDRIRAGWLKTGWEWPFDDDVQQMRFTADRWPLLDLAVVAALLIAYAGAPRPGNNVRLIGEVGLDGWIRDGVVYVANDRRYDTEGVARVVRHLRDLPDVLAWATATTYPMKTTGPI
jgi:hypothetical protein